MRKDRTEAAIHTTLRQARIATIQLGVGLALGFTAIYFLAPPHWLSRPYHLLESYASIWAAVFITANAWMYPRAKFQQPTADRMTAIMGNKILHFTRLELIQSMQADAAAQGKPGMYHLRPTSDFYSLYRLCGFGTYCFSGWPSKRDLFLAAGRPDAVIVIDPCDVPQGGILARKSDAAILLDGGYTGPATVLLMSEVSDEQFAAA